MFNQKKAAVNIIFSIFILETSCSVRGTAPVVGASRTDPGQATSELLTLQV